MPGSVLPPSIRVGNRAAPVDSVVGRQVVSVGNECACASRERTGFVSCARGAFQSEVNVVGVGDVSSLASLCFALLRFGSPEPGKVEVMLLVMLTSTAIWPCRGGRQGVNGLMVGMQSFSSEVKVDGQEFGGAGTDDQQ